MKKAKLSNVVVLDEKMLKEIANGEKKIDGRKNNTGRPVNKKSARQARLAKQAFYADVNNKFKSGVKFEINNSVYSYDSKGYIANELTGHVCNVDYIGRTKVKGFTFVMGKKVTIELNLKTLKFVE